MKIVLIFPLLPAALNSFDGYLIAVSCLISYFLGPEIKGVQYENLLRHHFSRQAKDQVMRSIFNLLKTFLDLS